MSAASDTGTLKTPHAPHAALRSLSALLAAAGSGRRIEAAHALAVLPETPAEGLMPCAEDLTLAGFGETSAIHARCSFL